MNNDIRAAAARDRFTSWAAVAGFTLTQPFEWRGSQATYPATCPEGHGCAPHPSRIQRGQGGCQRCGARAKSVKAETAFLTWAASSGYELHGFEWRGNGVAYEATCPEGHACAPIPTCIQRGQGGCPACARRVWDVFYVVTGPDGVKFGITSGDPAARLSKHRIDGYRTVVRLYEGLPEGAAREAETRCKRELKASGFVPVRGREYFGLEALATVLEVSASLSR